MTTIKELIEKKKHLEYIIDFLKEELDDINYEIQDNIELEMM